MSFGFSAGDFVAVGKLVRDIAACLRDARGSKIDYQELVRELECLRQALEHLDKFPNNEPSSTILDSIKYAALSCRRPLEDFLARIRKYDTSLGIWANAGALRGTTDQLRWGMSKKEEISKLQSYLNIHSDQSESEDQLNELSKNRKRTRSGDELQPRKRTKLTSPEEYLNLLRNVRFSRDERTVNLQRKIAPVGMQREQSPTTQCPEEILLVVHAFQARSPDELSLYRGNRIQVIERDEEFGDSWFLGRNIETGDCGLFPEANTRSLPEVYDHPLPEICTRPFLMDVLLVVHEFQARSSDELSIFRGDRVAVIERDDDFGDGWFLGRNTKTGDSGLFPEVYTRPLPGVSCSSSTIHVASDIPLPPAQS